MIKNYSILVLISFFLFSLELTSQEIRIFKVEDFDLKGNVKTCLVSTNYGKEEYNFNENGLLTKSVTRYSESDYDSTTYTYTEGFLKEKRFENYSDNIFDPATSIANMYTIDSTENLKITEKIISYEKEFLDQYEYFFRNDTVHKIVRTNNEGNDETLISYEKLQEGSIKTYELNNVIKESIQTSEQKENDSLLSKTILTKIYLEGAPISATEEVFDARNKLLTRTKFSYNSAIEKFNKDEVENYSYDEVGILLSSKSVAGKSIENKVYVYQFDANKNWIKEIISPANTYKTRKITYYETAIEEVEKE